MNSIQIKKIPFVLAGLMLLSTVTMAEKDVNRKSKPNVNSSPGKVANNCSPALAQLDLDINNVRTTLLTGGDLWWDGGNARYEIPKVEPGSGETSRNSLFAGALWFGGVDAGGNLKVAAATYGQGGKDFWPGPLTTSAASTNADVCAQYDKLWKVNRSEIDTFIANYDKDGYKIPESIETWPGNGDQSLGHAKNLAPFHDEDGDGLYNPAAGDYPEISGDQALWWVYNDKGNVHSEFGGDPIGLEVQVLAFGFATNDERNNMTFYKYRVINRSPNSSLDSTIFGQWVDPDLGFAFDDYVQCDVDRSLGICFNGDDLDENSNGYGLNPPSIGVDFFQGPLADANDGIDNNRNGVIDEEGETIIMSKFVYYNNTSDPVNGNPNSDNDVYNYLNGVWRNGQAITYGGNGTVAGGDPADFMFPGTTDPKGRPQWTEVTEGNTPEDRRFLQTAGPFTLKPGAVNEIIVGVVWARASSGGSTGSFDVLRKADDKAQILFFNDFKLIDGPVAPVFKGVELDREIILVLDQTKATEAYIDSIKNKNGDNINFKFQGYQVYQLANSTVTAGDLEDVTQARLIWQSDIQDGIGRIVNFEDDPKLPEDIPVIKVEGQDNGIEHTLQLKQDAFATGDNKLVNHKPYYFLVISYAFTDDPNFEQPYLAGRKVSTMTAIPHKTNPQNGGTVINSTYGDGVQITRIEGLGNGGNVLDLTLETEAQILSGAPYSVNNPVYNLGKGPLGISVYNPVSVPGGSFEFKLESTDNNWTITNEATGKSVSSSSPLDTGVSEKLLNGGDFDWGLVAKLKNVNNPGIKANAQNNNSFLEATVSFNDPTQQWLTFMPDNDLTPFNWLVPEPDVARGAPDTRQDPLGAYLNVLGGSWGPLKLASNNVDFGPQVKPSFASFIRNDLYENMKSVDVVFTADQSLWTRCIVIETGGDANLSEGNAEKWQLRKHTSVKKDGTPDASAGEGLGWFPGYAIDVESGKRLNIVFGEDSWLKSENGGDMLFNPTANLTRGPGGNGFDNFVNGGKHYLYVHNSTYDEGAAAKQILIDYWENNGSKNPLKDYLGKMGWMSIPLATGNAPFLSTDVRVRLRVGRAYAQEAAGTKTFQNDGYPLFKFSTEAIAAKTNNLEAAKSALSLVNIVPNPYFAFSTYENNQVDNRIRFTNLPKRATISIYTLSGNLVRRLEKDSDGLTSLDWDLKNSSRVPIASGMYIIHVDGKELGERTLKWFGVMRPIDLDTF